VRNAPDQTLKITPVLPGEMTVYDPKNPISKNSDTIATISVLPILPGENDLNRISFMLIFFPIWLDVDNITMIRIPVASAPNCKQPVDSLLEKSAQWR
jgi:hypothetical protein